MQQQNNSNKVNVLGDSNVDMILNLSDKKNLGEPTLFSGGSSANVASGLSKLGIDVSFFGSLGNDMYGKHVVDEMKADGIDVSNLELLDNYSTAMVIGVVEDNSERHFFLWPPEKGAHNQYTLSVKSTEDLLNCDWLHVSGISLRFSPVKETMLEAMRLCINSNKTVSFDLNLRSELWGLNESFKETVLQAVSLSSIVFGNLHEEFYPLFDADEDSLHSHISKNQIFICRNGEKGALGVTTKDKVESEALSISPVDSVGAGDAFNSGFIYASCIGKGMKESLDTGNKVAAYKLLGSGARHLPTEELLEEFNTKYSKY
jgi:sugar/nucleoside kinase (ribokinase family)